MSVQHHQAIKNSSKTERHYIRILDKNNGISTRKKKKKKEEIDKQSGSITNENTPAIVLDEESEYYDIFCLA